MFYEVCNFSGLWKSELPQPDFSHFQIGNHLKSKEIRLEQLSKFKIMKLITSLLAAASASLPMAALAQAGGPGPIRLVVPFAAGGGTLFLAAPQLR